MKGDKMAKRSSFGSTVRKRLSDITNSIPQSKSPIPDKKFAPTDSSAKNYIDHLVKENVALAKLVADKNKIIELTGIELQKIRVNLQKMQLQNWNLAQSNSHMLAELNIGRAKLKALQHEIACKEALFKAKNLELEVGSKGGEEAPDKYKTNDNECSQVGLREGEEALDKHKTNDNGKPGKGNRRRPTRSQSMGPSTTSKQGVEKEKSEGKRRCLRRQSARYRSQQQEPTEDLFEIADVRFPVGRSLDSPMCAVIPTPLGSPTRNEENNENCGPASEASESQRTSLGGRPLRRAVEKVQSYKEIPLNIKMRRSE